MVRYIKDNWPPIIATLVICTSLVLSSFLGMKSALPIQPDMRPIPEKVYIVSQCGHLNDAPPCANQTESWEHLSTSAQIEAASSTTKLFYTSLAGLILTSFGLIALFKTLRATQGALEEARAATDAARASVMVSEKYGYYQIRPYLSHYGISVQFIEAPKTDSFDAEDDIVEIGLFLKNAGRSPALIPECYAEIVVTDPSKDFGIVRVILQTSLIHKFVPAEGEEKIIFRGDIDIAFEELSLAPNFDVEIRGVLYYSGYFPSAGLPPKLEFSYAKRYSDFLSGESEYTKTPDNNRSQ